MKKDKKYQFKINNPCTEDWDQMTPQGKGRHCDKCDRVVVDFTTKSKSEILDILLKYEGQKVCGRFTNKHINEPFVYHTPKAKRSWRWASVAAMMVAGFFQLAPVTSYAQNPNNTMQRYPSTIHKFKGGHLPQQNTQQHKDTLYTCVVSVFEEDTDFPITNATIEIDSLGTFYSDENGKITITAFKKDIPRMLNVFIHARHYENKEITLNGQYLAKSSELSWYLKPAEYYELMGDVAIDDIE